MKFSSTLSRITLLTIAICLIPACGTLTGPWVYQEIARIKSPDSLVDAVVVTSDSGATSSLVTMLLIVPSGSVLPKDPDSYDEVLVADHIKGLKIVWKQSRLLEIQYQEARISKFQNYWQSEKVHNVEYVVELRLAPESSGFSLPFHDRSTQ